MDIDIDQSKRIGRLEDRMNMVENDLASISGKSEIASHSVGVCMSSEITKLFFW